MKIVPHTYHTSYRSRSIDDTLYYAKDYAQRLGISRVTESTFLDNIKVPVFAGIRPVALKGSLCVASGKGLTPQEAYVGAYMEAIEQALAEPGKVGLELVKALPEDILDCKTRPESVLDLCPRAGVEIFADQVIECVWAQDIGSDKTMLVPAQLVFIPYFRKPNHTTPFHSSTNGLCSGNSLVEAQIHGILEVIERDVASHLHFLDTSVIVCPESYPTPIKELSQKIITAGLELILRYTENEFGIPWFMGAVIDHQQEDPLFVDIGQGCHVDKQIAAIRAITEAVQSRMAVIHGGRDDVTSFHDKFKGWSFAKRRHHFHQKVKGWRDAKGAIDFNQIKNTSIQFGNLTQLRDELIRLLDKLGFSKVLNVSLTKKEEPLQVCKIIIPGLENFSIDCHAMGPRLAAHASKYFRQTFRWSQSDSIGQQAC